MWVESTADQIRAVLSGARCLGRVQTLCAMRRPLGSRGHFAAVETLTDELRRTDVLTVCTERFPLSADDPLETPGGLLAGAWQPEAARLWIEHPVRECLADFGAEPLILGSLSQSTPPGGVVADLVDVGTGDRPSCYEGKDVSGRIVLATGDFRRASRLAIERFGAAGILLSGMYKGSDNPRVRRSGLDLPDAILSVGLNPADPNCPHGFAFSLSYRQTLRLQRMLADGPIRLRAEVDASFGPGEMAVLDVRLPGTDPSAGEVWLVAHLTEGYSLMPGADDNCSGAAAVTEIMRVLAELVDSRNLPRPRRTIRALVVPEIVGTAAYARRYPDRAAAAIAGVNLDMVGADTAAAGSISNLVQTPWSRPTIANALGAAALEHLARTRGRHQGSAQGPDLLYDVCPFVAGSDHLILLGLTPPVPAVFFWQSPDRYYHTNLDTPDKLAPDTLRVMATAAATTAYALAAAGPDSGLAIAAYVEGLAGVSLAQGFARARVRVGTATPANRPTVLRNYLAHLSGIGAWHAQALADASGLCGAGVFTAAADSIRQEAGVWCSRLGRLVDVEPSHWSTGDHRTPERRGTRLPNPRAVAARIPDRAAWMDQQSGANADFALACTEVSLLCDGTRTVDDIIRLAVAEWPDLDADALAAYIGDLAAAELVAWR